MDRRGRAQCSSGGGRSRSGGSRRWSGGNSGEDMGHVCRQLVFHSCRGQLQGDTIAFTTKCFHDIIDEIANVNDTPRLPFQVWGVLEPNADGQFQMVDFGPAMALLGLDVTQKQLDLCYARMHEERGLKPPLFTTWKDPKNPSKATKTETAIPATTAAPAAPAAAAAAAARVRGAG